ncbi:fibronectin-like [Clupea harengus]|uniref:Fibronectin-like n=1 Tax=Clupea harengus TaxID=7950 RepID=A0A6P8FZD0_CLUHA|nr:fibronectin-like [Clupea harengus]
MLQCVLTGKAQEAYAALSVTDSVSYKSVKEAVLKVYEMVPEAYRQRFREGRKEDKQSYLEFARELVITFNRWLKASKSCLTCTASFCEVYVKQHYTAPALQRHTLVDATEDLEQRLCQRHNRDRELYCRTDQTGAYKSCLTCAASFCEVHVKQHYTAPALQRHTLVDATEDLEQRLCQRHNRDREIYCKTDQTRLQINKPEMENKTAVPPPGPIEFTSVKPDSVCLSWGPPEGLAGPHRFRVTWSGEGSQEHLQVQDLKLDVQGLTPGEEYLFTVATLSDDGRLSSCVSATVCTDIPPPGCLTVAVDLTSVSVTWSKPEGVVQASYLLTLYRDGECLNTVSIRSLQHRYEFEMKAEYTISVSTVLKGGQSKPISKTITTSYPVPEKLTVSSVTPTSANLSWSLHQGMEQFPHSFPISYHSEETELQTTSTESCSTTLTGLTPGTKYTVTVCCELRDGGRSQAATLVIKTGEKLD